MSTSSAVVGKPRGSKRPSKIKSPVKVSQDTIAGLSEVFKMLADESRLKIMLALAEHAELHVSALCELLGQTQPAVSHHLTLLRMTGLVGFRRDGKHNFYRVESGIVRDLLEDFFSDLGGANGSKQLPFQDFSLVFKRK